MPIGRSRWRGHGRPVAPSDPSGARSFAASLHSSRKREERFQLARSLCIVGKNGPARYRFVVDGTQRIAASGSRKGSGSNGRIWSMVWHAPILWHPESGIREKTVRQQPRGVEIMRRTRSLAAPMMVIGSLLVGLAGGNHLLPSPHGVSAADAPIPHGQSKPPGPALTPEEARIRMTVPEGFQVELVASEPDLVNPVAMTFDEQGRI